MAAALEQLQELQQFIGQTNRPERPDVDTEKLYFSEIHGLFHVEFYGSPFDESYEAFIGSISRAEVAELLRSLVFRGPDEGTNGTRNWDFTALLETDVQFPRLTSFVVEPTAPEHHNQTIIGVDYDEEGQIGELVARMPVLESLTVPSAPDASFFQVGERPVVLLRVETGYNHQGFIRFLARSNCFPALRFLDFGDYNQRYMPDYPAACTPFDDYLELFRSAAFKDVRRLNLRNPVLSTEQLIELREIRRDMEIFVIQSHGEYFRPTGR